MQPDASLSLIGVPSSAGAYAPGQEKAPGALRDAGLLELLRERGVAVDDRGDSDPQRWRPDRARPYAQNVATVAETVRETASRVRAAGHPALVLGGDCTVGLGAVALNRRCTRSSQVGAFFKFLMPLRGPGRPLRPSWRMIFHTSFLFTIRPCSISSAARTRSIP